MSSLFWFALPVFTGIIMLVQCIENPVLSPNNAEIEICKSHAGRYRKMISAIKDRRLSCHVCCKYDDETEEVYNSPDGQKCCDIVGGLPTGCCKDGKCPVGMQNCPKESFKDTFGDVEDRKK